jgi:hypothetical protein
MRPWTDIRPRVATLPTMPGCTTSGGAQCRTVGNASQQQTSTGQRRICACIRMRTAPLELAAQRRRLRIVEIATGDIQPCAVTARSGSVPLSHAHWLSCSVAGAETVG